MAHGIQTEDKGFVFGTTWHGLDQYVQLDRAVTYEEARSVMDYGITKEQLYMIVANGPKNIAHPVDAYSIVREDTGKVLVPHVGEQFALMANTHLLDFVNTSLIQQYDGLEIESVGTLFGGATSFLNIKLDEHHIKGDDSPTVSRLMYYNPLGRGAYKCCAHTIRIVCNNTLKMAEAQGAANDTLLKVRHTASAADRITDHLIDIAELKMGLKRHQEIMNIFANQSVSQEFMNSYLEALFPVDDNGTQTAKTRTEKKRAEIQHQFNTDQGLKGKVRDSVYGLLQATTYYFDHQKPRSDSDQASIVFNGIDGDRANTKARAFKQLEAMLAA